jgi:hypothetical protein
LPSPNGLFLKKTSKHSTLYNISALNFLMCSV